MPHPPLAQGGCIDKHDHRKELYVTPSSSTGVASTDIISAAGCTECKPAATHQEQATIETYFVRSLAFTRSKHGSCKANGRAKAPGSNRTRSRSHW